MKADYEHYKSHWEFFKSVNPKASELFFIDLQLKKLNETLENGLVNIDFSNDNTQTLEGYLNEQERQNFFFQKEYSEYLETRKADLLKVNNNELLEYNKVFFVHYQCDDFNEGEKIAALCIHSNGRAKEYSGDEAENIKEYANKVNELLNEGLFLVHWNQDRPYYGTDHIQKRYYDLTGKNLELEYNNGINLAEWLIFKYGQHYISHPRLDNLAKLNEFQGIREMEVGQRLFATNRLMLLTKIYFNALNETLKTEVAPILKALPPQQNEKPKPEPKETELSERIKKHFGFFNRNCPRKHKQILNDTDFEKLTEWTICYFENDFKVPEISEPIKVVNTNKTFVQLAFKYLFKELHKSSPYPETLFDFYQSAFNPYSEDKKSNFEAVKNNSEVKKLMQIDY